jgi:hypothetical protein
MIGPATYSAMKRPTVFTLAARTTLAANKITAATLNIPTKQAWEV